MSEKLIEVKVTARAGRRIPGYGSRIQGESFFLPAALAETVAQQDGLELAKQPRASKPKSEAKPLAESAPDVKENDNAV